MEGDRMLTMSVGGELLYLASFINGFSFYTVLVLELPLLTPYTHSSLPFLSPIPHTHSSHRFLSPLFLSSLSVLPSSFITPSNSPSLLSRSLPPVLSLPLATPHSFPLSIHPSHLPLPLPPTFPSSLPPPHSPYPRSPPSPPLPVPPVHPPLGPRYPHYARTHRKIQKSREGIFIKKRSRKK